MRAVLPISLVVWLCFPLAIAAQHGNHGAGAGSGSNPANSSSAPPDNPDLAGFKHAVQVQATPYQVTEFQTARKNTTEAVKGTHDFAQLAAEATSSSDLISHTTAVDDAVDEAQKSNAEFVNMLSNSQIDGLKKLLKELKKSAEEVAKQHKAFGQETGRADGDPRRIASEADKLEKALTTFQTSQVNLAKEMGIQNP